MGQTASTVPEDRMKKRIRQTIGSLVDLEAHLKQANEWARLCPTPRTCRLAFRIVINERISAEILPYVWRIRGNVFIEVRKLRRETQFPSTFREILPLVRGESTNESEDTESIGRARVLTVRQFYYVYCFLSDIKSCAVHAIQPGIEASTTNTHDEDDLECQICMDKQKQVVLPCTHSFCLYCFKKWTTQSKTCPICRSKLSFSEGDELWDLMTKDVEDIGTYATDLVSRIFEYLEKCPYSNATVEAVQRSEDVLSTAMLVKHASMSSFVSTDFFPSSFPLTLPSLGFQFPTHNPSGSPSEVADLMLALEIASGEDQTAAIRHYEQLRRDQVLAMALAMEVDEVGED